MLGELSKNVEEVGRGDGRVRKDEGRGSDGNWRERDGGGRAAVRRDVGGWVIPGVVGATEEVLNNLLGGDDVNLVDVVNGRPRGDGGGTSEGWGRHWLTFSQVQNRRLF